MDELSQPTDSSKRKRLNPTHRWTEQETKDFLDCVVDLIKDSPESFQKPTSQVFYEKIKKDRPLLKNISWALMKSKMANLKKSFISAVAWKNRTGSGLLEAGDETSVISYIHKLCPFFDRLSEIYGQRKNVTPDFVYETSQNEIQMLAQEVDLTSNVDTSLDTYDGVEITGVDTDDSRETLTPRVKRKVRPRNSEDPMQKLLSLKEEQIKIELERLQFEKEKEKQNAELKSKELENELKKEALRIESEERIKKFELELKYKSNLL